jgi:hypothetical protein
MNKRKSQRNILKYIKANHIVVDRLIYLFLESVRVPASGTEGVIQTPLAMLKTKKSMLPIALIGISLLRQTTNTTAQRDRKGSVSLAVPQTIDAARLQQFPPRLPTVYDSHFQVVTKDDLIGIVQASIS